ncbi:DDE transposase [Algimonas ampicilliniresistens]|uniref:DDE transposase n=1 Tax=Algimonas ampicilliniresistens TaxID=1298735 RepID=A0ABQ5VCH6_9PROT|nr:IS1595 family transposase [Algimonas ampicilliniresistens]GLQ24488.1 DDE transposase [Algimonas ampicilliniresistens]
MSILSKSFFHNEAAAFAYLEELIWQGQPVCPHCGEAEKVGALKPVTPRRKVKNADKSLKLDANGNQVWKYSPTRYGIKKCYACRKQFTVTVGTVFESSHVPLHKWLQAAFLMMSSKKGISSKQLERTLEVTYKTAWFMSHRLREAMMQGDLPPMGGEGVVVEADETYFGNRISLKKKKAAKRRGVKGLGGGPGNKFPIVSLVERGGSVRSFNVDRANKHTVSSIVRQNVDRRSRLMTDESLLYKDVGPEYAGHEAVNHSRGEYVRGEAYTNTLEGYYSIFKRGMKGVYQHCNEKHLHRYLAEFDFRYNNRERLGVNDMGRTANALQGIVGKRLTYRSVDGQAAC